MPDHVHAPCVLLVLGDCGQPRAARTVRGPVQALRGDAEPADVPQFQGSGDLLGRASFGLQSCPLALEVVSVRARDAADRVSRGRFQKHGVGAPQGFLLEPRRDGTPIDRLAGEQIGGAHERPDGDATRRQRRGQGGDHRGGQGIVDPAGEGDREFLSGAAGIEVLPNHLDHGFPEHEARTRPDVPAAFAPLEDEASRPVAQERAEQPR